MDANCPQSDPLVWTGSHNWSSSANSRNDENSIVIHDSTTVNLYYQEYMQRYKEEGATEFVVDRCDFVDITENEITSSIHLYPNPASQFITVQIPELSGKGVIFIYDFTGKLILTQDARGEFETINIGELRPGMYLVVVRNGNNNWTTNFIKTR